MEDTGRCIEVLRMHWPLDTRVYIWEMTDFTWEHYTSLPCLFLLHHQQPTITGIPTTQKSRKLSIFVFNTNSQINSSPNPLHKTHAHTRARTHTRMYTQNKGIQMLYIEQNAVFGYQKPHNYTNSQPACIDVLMWCSLIHWKWFTSNHEMLV